MGMTSDLGSESVVGETNIDTGRGFPILRKYVPPTMCGTLELCSFWQREMISNCETLEHGFTRLLVIGSFPWTITAAVENAEKLFPYS